MKTYNDMTPAERADVDRAHAVQQARASIKRRASRVKQLTAIVARLLPIVEGFDTTIDYSEFQAAARGIDGLRTVLRMDEDAIRRDQRVLE